MSLEPAQVRAHLQRILAEESVLLSELEQLLQQEAQALDENNLERMTSIGATRHARVQALARLDSERADLCRMLSFGRGVPALERLLEWVDPQGGSPSSAAARGGPGSGIRSGWRANLEVAARCKALNDRNGAIVAARLGHVQRRLQVLRGSAGAPPVYGPKGLRYGALGARDFGSA